MSASFRSDRPKVRRPTNAVSKLNHALQLAAQGFRVFPLNEDHPDKSAVEIKRPAIKNWDKLATTDPAVIQRWWEKSDFNIGLATGRGLVVLDSDTKEGKQGAKAIATHDMLGLPFDGMQVETATGGLHLYFKSNQEIRNSASKIAKDVDVRGDGGYVVAPGSTIHGKPYTGKNGFLHELPEWMAAMAKGPKHQKYEDLAPLVEWDKPENIRRATEYLVNEAPEGFVGNRNHTAFKVMAHVKDFGISETECKALMVEHYFDVKCPSLDTEDELNTTLSSVYRNGQLPPGIADPTTVLGDVTAELSTTETKTDDYTWLKPQEIPEDFDFAKIPSRQWIVPELLARGFVSGLISPGGVGKTQWGASLSIALPTGRGDICGFQVKAPAKVWVWNQEDDKDELNRRLAAAMQKFGVKAKDLAGKLCVNSGVDKPLLLAKRKADRTLVEAAEVEFVIQFIKDNQIDVFIIDPLVEFHEGEENDNVQMRKIMATARRIAVEGNCAVLVVAHTKKPPQAAAESYAGDVDALRGAGAQGNVMRIAYTLFGMSKKEAKRWGVREDEAHLYVRMDDAKANLFLKKDQPRWFKRVSAQLASGEAIGVLEPVALSKSQSTDVLEIAAKTIAAGNGLSRGERYALSKLMDSMTVSEKTSFGSSTNRSRIIKDALDSPGWVAQPGDVYVGLTAYGKLTVQKKKGRGGLQFCLDAEATAV
jgi:hypothetical protein